MDAKLEALKKMAKKGRKGAESHQNDSFDSQEKFAEGGMRDRDKGDRYKQDDYSEEELANARSDRKKRGSTFVRPGESSNEQRKKTTLQKMRDYFNSK